MKKKLADAAIVKQFVQDMPGQMKMFEEEQAARAEELMKNIEIPAGYEIRPKRRGALIQCYVNEDIKEEIKSFADEEGISVNEFLNALLCAFIEVKRAADKK